MCSYNAINGVPSCVNEEMLGGKLRGDFGFQAAPGGKAIHAPAIGSGSCETTIDTISSAQRQLYSIKTELPQHDYGPYPLGARYRNCAGFRARLTSPPGASSRGSLYELLSLSDYASLLLFMWRFVWTVV